MPKYEHSKNRRDSKGRAPKREGRGRQSYSDSARGRRDSSRDSGRRGPPRRDFGRSFGGRDSSRSFGGRGGGRRRELEMTKVTCSACGEKCEVPFKPTSSKPVFCSDCFSKNKGSSGGGSSSRDLDAINKKLDKIMAALEIE